jgi:hypothetical protein
LEYWFVQTNTNAGDASGYCTQIFTRVANPTPNKPAEQYIRFRQPSGWVPWKRITPEPSAPNIWKTGAGLGAIGTVTNLYYEDVQNLVAGGIDPFGNVAVGEFVMGNDGSAPGGMGVVIAAGPYDCDVQTVVAPQS